jgi:DNA polymerase-3 subunit delta
VAAQPLKPVYLIAGSDRPKVSLAVRRLRARFEEGSVELLSADAASGADAVAAANALGLFGGGERLVVVEGIESWKRADVDAVTEYVRSPNPGAVLALVGESEKLAGLAEAVASVGDVLRYDVPKRKRRGREEDDYVSWVRDRLDRAGVRIDQEAVERLVELVGPDAFSLQSEVEKLAAWSEEGGDVIGVADVEALAIASAEASASTLTNAWASRDAAGALLACEAELRGQPEPFWLAGRLAAHVSRTRAVQRLVEQGVPLPEIGKRLGLRFPPRREAGAARAYSADELASAVVRIAALDHAIKGGSRLDPVLELERALVEITEASDSHGR